MSHLLEFEMSGILEDDALDTNVNIYIFLGKNLGEIHEAELQGLQILHAGKRKGIFSNSLFTSEKLGMK